MPTVFRSGPYRLFFYAGDQDEPPHIHVQRDQSEANFWLDPVRLERSYGFAANEISKTVDTSSSMAVLVCISDDQLACDLSDGRTISVPLAWYPRLLHGTLEERNQWELQGGGRGIHWSALDEDISIDNLLLGKSSGESQNSFKKWLAARSS